MAWFTYQYMCRLVNDNIRSPEIIDINLKIDVFESISGKFKSSIVDYWLCHLVRTWWRMYTSMDLQPDM